MVKGRRQLLTGALIILAGAVMPWAKLTSILGTQEVNGLDGDGKLTLAVSIVLLLTVGAHTGQPGKVYSVLGLVLSLAVLLVAATGVLRLWSAAGEVSVGIRVHLRIGLYATLVGSVIAAVGSSRRMSNAVSSQPDTVQPSPGSDGDEPMMPATGKR